MGTAVEHIRDMKTSLENMRGAVDSFQKSKNKLEGLMNSADEFVSLNALNKSMSDVEIDFHNLKSSVEEKIG